MGVHPGAQHGKKRMNIISPLWERIKANDKLHLAWCVSGVVGCLMLYGVLQERIMTRPFGEPGKDAEHFKYSLFLVLCNRLTSCAVAIFGLVSDGKLSEIKPVAPLYSYAAVSLSNVVATTCQYEALKYVTFPVQTLGKCAKMIPVMIWGIMIMRKKYTLKDFGIAVAVTGGCTLFLLTGSVQSKVSASLWDSQVYGLLLMLGYLGFDGFTSTFQDKLFKGFQMTTYNQILYTTLWSSLLSCFGLITSGQMPLAMQFVRQHPEALSQIIMLSAAASTGALFISYTIKTFGALIFATIMTTRQFLSILLSCFLFLHPLSLGQWVGTTIVFGALYYQGFAKGKDKDKQHREAPKQSPDEEAQELLANKADTAEFKSEGPK
uniref:Sugar phosphate transporter domain-containing protein n=1 Tax=Dunaliella tertiolecta TaxID=3047 RepID=A0A7S3VIB7_DUNTE|mmetsp:Transcript_17475/g.45805  ORF Transcript_17475/g.45805 Transcript_17475/m.45805 type:complete len:378 (+) Transcript_17475:96-1229(+)